MDGFVIEKPEKEEEEGSSSINASDGSNNNQNSPNIPMTTPMPSFSNPSEETQTETTTLFQDMKEEDAVFTSPSNKPNFPTSTGTSATSDNMNESTPDNLSSSESVTDLVSGVSGTQNPFIDSTESTISIDEDSKEDSMDTIESEIDIQGTPAFATTTENAISPTSTSNDLGSQSDSSTEDTMSSLDVQTVSSITEIVDNNTDSSNQLIDSQDNDLIGDNTPSIDGVNVIPGVIQTISSQIEVSDANSNNSESMNTSSSDSAPSNIVDGFDVGNSSTEEDTNDDPNIPDQGGSLGLNNQSAIDIVITGDGGINDNNNLVVTDEDIKYLVQSGSLYECTEPGYFPYELNCVEFYVCIEILPNVLSADQLYRCPKRYLFDDKTNRCQKEEKVTCNRPISSTNAPTKTNQNVLVVSEEFVDSFFNTSLTYNIPLV